MASEFQFMDKSEAFFDDDIDNTQIRFEEGEDMEAYGFREANEHEIEAAMNGECGDGCHEGDSSGQKPEVDDYDFRMEGNSGPASHNLPRRGPGGKSQNTGPKGVKKDYEDAKKATKINREMDMVRRERMIRQHVVGKKMWYIDGQNQVRGFTQPVDEEGKVMGKSENPNVSTKFRTAKSVDDSQDEEYLKLKRSRESMLQSYQDDILEHQSELCGTYIRAANLDTVAAMLKSSHPDCYSILHVYDNENPCCQHLHMIFEDLTTMFPHIMFFRARQEEILPNFDRRFLPTILIYKGTKKVDELIGVTALWGIKPEDEAVVNTLAEKRYLQLPTGGHDVPTEAERRRNFVASMDNESDDDWLDAE